MTTLTGIVTDVQHTPLRGVYVSIEGTGRFTITDEVGRYTLHGPLPLHQFYTVNYYKEGYKTVEEAVMPLPDPETSLDVRLEEV